jgi:hypothetical protein
MRKFAIAIAACAFVAGVVGTTSAAAPQSYDTQLYIIDAGTGPNGVIIFGALDSEKKKCWSDRDMQVFSKASKAKRRGTLVLDEMTSSDNGAWAASLDQKAINMKVKVFSKTLGNGDVCKGATEPLT